MPQTAKRPRKKAASASNPFLCLFGTRPKLVARAVEADKANKMASRMRLVRRYAARTRLHLRRTTHDRLSAWVRDSHAASYDAAINILLDAWDRKMGGDSGHAGNMGP